jgi:hypothetical protein
MFIISIKDDDFTVENFFKAMGVKSETPSATFMENIFKVIKKEIRKMRVPKGIKKLDFEKFVDKLHDSNNIYYGELLKTLLS